MRVSVVIPTRNRAVILRQTVESFLRQTYPDFEILVVDQSDEENHDFKPWAASYPRRIQYFHIDTIGSPAARNFGICQAFGEVILSTDDDVITEPDLLLHHTKHYEDAGIGAVAGRVLTREDKPLHSIRAVGTYNHITGLVKSNFNATRPQEVQHAQGSNFSFRTDLAYRIGGFDPAFSALGHFEEMDFSLRIRGAGYRITFEPRACVNHLQYSGGGNRPLTFRERTYWHFHNYALLHRKHMPRWSLPIFVVVQLIRMLGYSFRKKDLRVGTCGLSGFVKGFCKRLKG